MSEVQLTNIQILLCNLPLLTCIRNRGILRLKLRAPARRKHEGIGTRIIHIASSIHCLLQGISLPTEDIICVVAISGPCPNYQNAFKTERKVLSKRERKGEAHGSP